MIKIHQIITKGLVVTLQPVKHQKKDEEHKHQSSNHHQGLVVTLQPGQHQKKDEERKHQHHNHHHMSCCHIAGVNIKRRMRNTNIKSSKFIKIITTHLVVTLQPGQHQKKDQEHKHQNHQNHHQRSCCHIAARSTSKKDEENTNIKIIKIHQNHHQRSCCHIAAGSTSKEG